MNNVEVVEIDLIEACPEIQLIDLLMKASKQLDDTISQDEKDRAVNYFNEWHEAQDRPTTNGGVANKQL